MYTISGAIAAALRLAGSHGTVLVYKAWHNRETFESDISFGVSFTLPTFGIRAGNVYNGVFVPNPSFDDDVARIRSYHFTYEEE
jgi:Na+/glutamate symporter